MTRPHDEVEANFFIERINEMYKHDPKTYEKYFGDKTIVEIKDQAIVNTPKPKKKFKLGKKSKRELIGVHPYLSFAVYKAIERVEYDFGVFDGLRTKKEQEKLVDRGWSKTKDSYHLYGLAVDLVPYLDGQYRWTIQQHEDTKKAFENIHTVMKSIIEEYDLPIENGWDLWHWDKPHWQMTGWKNKYDYRKFKY